MGENGHDRAACGADRLCARLNRRPEAGAPARRVERCRLLLIFDDYASGAKADRPGLAEALNYLRTGDTLVVCGLDPLGRSMKPTGSKKVGELAACGVGFRSLTEQIDTTTSGGMLVFNIFGSLAQIPSATLSGQAG